MTSYDFTKKAEKMFLKLPKDVQYRIIHKIEHYLKHPNPLAFAKRIRGSPVASFRFQISNYRVVFDWEENSILITKVGHRSNIYRE